MSDRTHLLTAKQVAEWLGVSERQVRRWGESGAIPRIRLGHSTVRYDAENVEAFLLRCSMGGKP